MLFQKKGDERLSLTAEFIAGIRMLKLNALEFVYKDKIQKIRKAELKLLMKDSVFWALNSTCWDPTLCYFPCLREEGDLDRFLECAMPWQNRTMRSP